MPKTAFERRAEKLRASYEKSVAEKKKADKKPTKETEKGAE